MTDTAGPRQQVEHLVAVWYDAARSVSALLRSLGPDDWHRPTDLPGWDVHAVAAHLAHLESELAGLPQDEVEVPDAPHVRGLMGQFTERGPLARRSRPGAAVVDELDAAVAARHAALLADPPADPTATAPGFAGLLGWSWRTLLSNRALDVWMHEQDVRRAVGRPGRLDSPGAAHVVGVLVRSLPYVLGKKVGAAPGTTVRVRVTGEHPHDVLLRVGDDGRAAAVPTDPPADPPADPGTSSSGDPAPDATITMTGEELVLLGGGRRPPDSLAVRVEGDPALAARFLAAMPTTP